MAIDPSFTCAPRLLEAYPDDPRSSFFAGMASLRRGDTARAERLTQVAIAKAEAQSWRLRPNLPNVLRAGLVYVLSAEGRKADAQALGQRLCAVAGPSALGPPQRNELTGLGLCDDRS